MKRIILFFGSFNPVHRGHVAIAEYALREGLADGLWFVVSPRSPFKERDGLAPEGDRLEMVKIAIGGSAEMERMAACDIEFGMPVPSYTIDTLERLWAAFPAVEFSILMGADNLPGLDRWKEYRRIVARCPIFVYGRKGCEIDERLLSLGNITALDAPEIDISSTEIRRAPRNEICRYLPAGVPEYIEKHGLYDSVDN